jgi:hypothetical protein
VIVGPRYNDEDPAVAAAYDHEPCCEHAGMDYGNCWDCMNTGHAHAPNVEPEPEEDR